MTFSEFITFCTNNGLIIRYETHMDYNNNFSTYNLYAFNLNQTSVYITQIDNEEDKQIFESTYKLSDFQMLKAEKIEEIKKGFLNAFACGHFMSIALGIEVDCRRSADNNDLQNVEGLIADFDSLEGYEKYYVGYAETTENQFTLEQLYALKKEMAAYGRSIYKRKWIFENQVTNADTPEDLTLIEWID